MIQIFGHWFGVSAYLNQEYIGLHLSFYITLGFDFTWKKSNDWLRRKKCEFRKSKDGLWLYWKHGELFLNW